MSNGVRIISSPCDSELGGGTYSPWTDSPNFSDASQVGNIKTQRLKEKFGARVRQLRAERLLSQEAMAHRCDLDRSYIGGVERGERNISLVNIHRIADALGVEAGELFK